MHFKDHCLLKYTSDYRSNERDSRRLVVGGGGLGVVTDSLGRRGLGARRVVWWERRSCRILSCLHYQTLHGWFRPEVKGLKEKEHTKESPTWCSLWEHRRCSMGVMVPVSVVLVCTLRQTWILQGRTYTRRRRLVRRTSEVRDRNPTLCRNVSGESVVDIKVFD